MLALVALVVAVGLADSINPSTIAPALYYATTAGARATLLGFAAGAFLAYFAGGVLVLLGGRELVTSLAPHLSGTAKHAIEVGGGVLVLGVAAGVWLLRSRVTDYAAKPRVPRARSSLALGAAIMAVELPTAFPYFAAIAAVSAAGVNIAAQLALIGLYNVLFVAPLLAILAARSLAGARGERVLQSGRDWVERNAPAVLAGTLAVVGLAFLALGIAGLA